MANACISKARQPQFLFSLEVLELKDVFHPLFFLEEGKGAVLEGLLEVGDREIEVGGRKSGVRHRESGSGIGKSGSGIGNRGPG